MTLYYQIDHTLTEVPDDAAYFHAQFRRSNPLPYKTDHVLLDGVKGWGQYVGTYLAWGVNNTGWWGEGEIKFFLDGDGKFPTICGTGTEDYFCGSYNFDNQETHRYRNSPLPIPVWRRSSVLMASTSRNNASACIGGTSWTPSGLKRISRSRSRPWAGDPVAVIYPLQDDISSVAFWYQTEPHASFPKLAR